MLNNNNKFASSIVTLTDNPPTSETAKSTYNLAKSNQQIEATRKSLETQQLKDITRKLKAAKKIFDFVKSDTKTSINKAKIIRNNALKRVYQAEEVLQGAKEDWKTKVITANKKIQEFKSNPQKRYLREQVNKAIYNVKQAKENIQNKQVEVTKKRMQLKQLEHNLRLVKKIQESRIKFAELAYMQVEIEQQKAIQSTENPTLGWGISGKVHYKR